MNGTYWEGIGSEQLKYDEMRAAGWEFLKKNWAVFYSYYRYYNDGDLPGWARGRRSLLRNGRFGWELNNDGLMIQEQRVTDAVLAEYKRFMKANEG